MLVDQGYKIDESTPVYGPAQPLFNANLSLVRDKKVVKVEAFPPDQLLIKSDWNSPLLSKCPMSAECLRSRCLTCARWASRTSRHKTCASERRESVAEEYREQQHGDFDDDDLGDESQTTGWLRIEFVLVDKDGDGIAERQIIYRLTRKSSAERTATTYRLPPPARS